ncbi:MAG: glycerate kinase [Bacteroidota bacterium]|nr:MAG: glycerate kinase [Bacteroidota bacterium]
MKILIAFDSLKDCMNAEVAGQYLSEGLWRASPSFDIRNIPMADGGEGTAVNIVKATNGGMRICKVRDALLRLREAKYGFLGDGITAVIEMAAASGIEHLTQEERNPWVTSTFGTGELIIHALDLGCRRIILGIGGSATNDGGSGMAAALGAKLLDVEGKSISPGGGSLSKLSHIDLSGLDARIAQTEFLVACDVSNPLTGENGASRSFAAQKGAEAWMIEALENNLVHYAQTIHKELGLDIEKVSGAGAAGGLGAGLLAFCKARLENGFSLIADLIGFEAHCKWADLVITGEGKMDGQTLSGKTPIGVARAARKFGKPVIAIAGALGKDYEKLLENDFDAIFCLSDGESDLQTALRKAPVMLRYTGYSVGRLLNL